MINSFARKTFKKIVLQQAKELTDFVIPASQQSQPAALKRDVDLLSTRLSPLTSEGSIVFDPCGPFQEFVLRVEDSVLNNLLHFSDGQPIDDFTKYFCDAAIATGEWDPDEAVYIYSSIGIIRLCIRVIAAKDPDMLVDNMDKILQKIATSKSSLKLLRRNALNEHAKSLANIKEMELNYALLDDDPFADLMHMNRLQLNGLKSFGIHLQGCGTPQIHGIYIPVTKSKNPSYAHPDGYIITRIKRTILMPSLGLVEPLAGAEFGPVNYSADNKPNRFGSSAEKGDVTHEGDEDRSRNVKNESRCVSLLASGGGLGERTGLDPHKELVIATKERAADVAGSEMVDNNTRTAVALVSSDKLTMDPAEVT